MWGQIDPERGRQELRTLMRAGRHDGFVPHTAFWQASPRWRRAPLYATKGYRGDNFHSIDWMCDWATIPKGIVDYYALFTALQEVRRAAVAARAGRTGAPAGPRREVRQP